MCRSLSRFRAAPGVAPIRFVVLAVSAPVARAYRLICLAARHVLATAEKFAGWLSCHPKTCAGTASNRLGTTIANAIIAARKIRKQFGGHDEKKKGGSWGGQDQ
jgi:hypothetical protein